MRSELLNKERKGSRPEAVDLLLDKLIREDKPAFYHVFMNGLKEAKFEVIVQILEGHVNVKHQEMFNRLVNAYLPDLVTVERTFSATKLIPYLKQLGCITERDAEEIRRLEQNESPYLAALVLLQEYLASRHEDWFSHFLYALKNAGDDHLCKLFDPELDKAKGSLESMQVFTERMKFEYDEDNTGKEYEPGMKPSKHVVKSHCDGETSMRMQQQVVASQPQLSQPRVASIAPTLVHREQMTPAASGVACELSGSMRHHELAFSSLPEQSVPLQHANMPRMQRMAPVNDNYDITMLKAKVNDLDVAAPLYGTDDSNLAMGRDKVMEDKILNIPPPSKQIHQDRLGTQSDAAIPQNYRSLPETDPFDFGRQSTDDRCSSWPMMALSKCDFNSHNDSERDVDNLYNDGVDNDSKDDDSKDDDNDGNDDDNDDDNDSDDDDNDASNKEEEDDEDRASIYSSYSRETTPSGDVANKTKDIHHYGKVLNKYKNQLYFVLTETPRGQIKVSGSESLVTYFQQGIKSETFIVDTMEDCFKSRVFSSTLVNTSKNQEATSVMSARTPKVDMSLDKSPSQANQKQGKQRKTASAKRQSSSEKKNKEEIQSLKSSLEVISPTSIEAVKPNCRKNMKKLRGTKNPSESDIRPTPVEPPNVKTSSIGLTSKRSSLSTKGTTDGVRKGTSNRAKANELGKSYPLVETAQGEPSDGRDVKRKKQAQRKHCSVCMKRELEVALKACASCNDELYGNCVCVKCDMCKTCFRKQPGGKK